MAQTQLSRVFVQAIDGAGDGVNSLSIGTKSLTTRVNIGGIGTESNSIQINGAGTIISGPVAMGIVTAANTTINNASITNLGVTANVSMTNVSINTLAVVGQTTLANIGVTGQTTLQNTSVNGTLRADGQTTLINVSTTSLTASSLGANSLTILNNVSVGGNVSVGSLYVSSNLILPQGSNTVLANASVNGTLKVDGITTLKDVTLQNASINVDTRMDGALRVNGGTNFYNTVNVQGANTFTVGGQTTLQNTSVQGLTAAGKTWLSNTSITGPTDINVTGTATTTIGGTSGMTVVAGNASLRNVSAQALTVGPLWAGATTLASSSVTGNETVGGTLGVTGLATLSGGISTGTITIPGIGSIWSYTGTLPDRRIVINPDTINTSANGQLELGRTYGLYNLPYSSTTTDGAFMFRTTNPDGTSGSVLTRIQNMPNYRFDLPASGVNIQNTITYATAYAGGSLTETSGYKTLTNPTNDGQTAYGMLDTNATLFTNVIYKVCLKMSSVSADSVVYLKVGNTVLSEIILGVGTVPSRIHTIYFKATETGNLIFDFRRFYSLSLTIVYDFFSIERFYETSMNSLSANSLSASNMVVDKKLLIGYNVGDIKNNTGFDVDISGCVLIKGTADKTNWPTSGDLALGNGNAFGAFVFRATPGTSHDTNKLRIFGSGGGIDTPLLFRADGRLGIGTTDPNAPLEVRGKLSSTGPKITCVIHDDKTPTLALTSGLDKAFGTSHAVIGFLGGGSGGGGGSGIGVNYEDGSDTAVANSTNFAARIKCSNDIANVTGVQPSIYFQTKTTIQYAAGGATDNGLYSTIMTLKGDNRRVGIGTTTPVCTLDVSGQTRLGTPNNFGGLQVQGTTAQDAATSHDFILGEKQYGRALIIRTEPDLSVASGSATDTESTSKTYFFHWGSSKTITFKHGGNVGIFASSASYPLDVNGQIRGTNLAVTSDRRIKTNIVDVEDDAALQLLRRLKPKTYTYKDTTARGTEPVYGFIAQEVREVLNYSTSITKDALPNIYESATLVDDILTLTTFNTTDLSRDASGSLFSKIKIKTNDGKEEFVNILEVIDEHTLKVDTTLWSKDSSGNLIGTENLFVYGQEVNDFHNLNKDAIWTVATAALQEVDRQLQAEKQKTATLETTLASTQETLASTQATLASTQETLAALVARVNALEQR